MEAPARASSVVQADVAEQVGHGLSVVDAADSLRQNHADVHRLDLGTLQLLDLVGNGVGHDHLQRTGRREDTAIKSKPPKAQTLCFVCEVKCTFHLFVLLGASFPY